MHLQRYHPVPFLKGPAWCGAARAQPHLLALASHFQADLLPPTNPKWEQGGPLTSSYARKGCEGGGETDVKNTIWGIFLGFLFILTGYSCPCYDK